MDIDAARRLAEEGIATREALVVSCNRVSRLCSIALDEIEAMRAINERRCVICWRPLPDGKICDGCRDTMPGAVFLLGEAWQKFKSDLREECLRLWGRIFHAR